MSQDAFDRFDEMAERTIYPWIDDESHDNSDELTAAYFLDRYDGVEQDFEEDYDDGMDGDHESALGSAGWGENEYYGDYGDDGDW
jgi:hypothetical protein